MLQNTFCALAVRCFPPSPASGHSPQRNPCSSPGYFSDFQVSLYAKQVLQWLLLLLRCPPLCVCITVSMPPGQFEPHLLAGTHVRAAATIGGNLVLLRERAMQSNLAPVLIALKASVIVTSLHSQR